MIETKRFGIRLKELRTRKGLSQRQLAEMMSVSNAAIANWEVGKRLPDLTMLSRLADCLEAEPWVLLDALGVPAEPPGVLVVEDAPIILRGLLRTLREELPQAQIQGFRTGCEALDYAASHCLGIAFLDIELAGESGIELTEKLKQRIPRLNIIFLTSHTEYTRQALDSHCSGYILKPLTPEKLRRELANLRFPVRGLEL